MRGTEYAPAAIFPSSGLSMRIYAHQRAHTGGKQAARSGVVVILMISWLMMLVGNLGNNGQSNVNIDNDHTHRETRVPTIITIFMTITTAIIMKLYNYYNDYNYYSNHYNDHYHHDYPDPPATWSVHDDEPTMAFLRYCTVNTPESGPTIPSLCPTSCHEIVGNQPQSERASTRTGYQPLGFMGTGCA